MYFLFARLPERCMILLVVLACNASTVFADTYYVSPAGKGAGTKKQPGAINNILPLLKPGDRMLLLSGEYKHSQINGVKKKSKVIIDMNKYFHFAISPTKEQPITIAAAPGNKPVLNGEGVGQGILCDSKSSHNLVIEGLIFKNFWQAGIRIGYDVPQKNILIRNCEFSGIKCNDNMGGVYLHSSSNITIDKCSFHDFIYERKNIRTQGLGLILFRCKDITVSNNLFYNLHQALYYKHGENKTGAGGYTRISGNTFKKCSIATNQNRTEFMFNLLIKSTFGIHNEDGTIADFTFDVNIQNNTFIDGGLRFPIQHSAAAKFTGPRNISVLYNIFFKSPYNVWEYGSDDEWKKGGWIVSDYNCFWNPAGKQIIKYFSNSNPVYEGANTGGKYSLKQWQKLGFDRHSVEIDPLFRNIRKGDYRLRSESQCKTMGAFPLQKHNR